MMVMMMIIVPFKTIVYLHRGALQPRQRRCAIWRLPWHDAVFFQQEVAGAILYLVRWRAIQGEEEEGASPRRKQRKRLLNACYDVRSTLLIAISVTVIYLIGL